MDVDVQFYPRTLVMNVMNLQRKSKLIIISEECYTQSVSMYIASSLPCAVTPCTSIIQASQFSVQQKTVLVPEIYR